ncbi:MAG: energy-coupling factor ABC transporter ATP-binding protein [bacterium]
MEIVRFEDYAWRYARTEVPALKGINLEIEEGSFIGVIGPNGGGKSTLAYSINGLIPNQYYGVRKGHVYVAGKEVEDYHSDELTQMVGVVFSDPESQITSMTVEDEVVFGMENIGLSVSDIQERLDWVVPLTKIGPLMEKPPYEISGGQKARVALASVLAMTPQILVLDEPTSMLDPISRKQIFEVLARMKQELKSTIVVIEHSLEYLVPLAERMVLLYDGDVLLTGETRSFFEQMDLLLEHEVFPPGAMQFFHALMKVGDYQGDLPLTLSSATARLRSLMDESRR